MKAADRKFIRFTRSSVIVPPKIGRALGLSDGSQFLSSILHDVNGSGMLYGINKTDILGDLYLQLMPYNIEP
jgi:hypothetical protein